MWNNSRTQLRPPACVSVIKLTSTSPQTPLNCSGVVRQGALVWIPAGVSTSIHLPLSLTTHQSFPKGVVQWREGCLTPLLEPAVCAKQASTVHHSSVSFSDQYQPRVYVVSIPFQGLAMRLWQQLLMINTNHVHSLVHNRHHKHSIHMNGRLADFGTYIAIGILCVEHRHTDCTNCNTQDCVAAIHELGQVGGLLRHSSPPPTPSSPPQPKRHHVCGFLNLGDTTWYRCTSGSRQNTAVKASTYGIMYCKLWYLHLQSGHPVLSRIPRPHRPKVCLSL